MMGMFDYVVYNTNCESCGEPLSNFQSKDSSCQMKTLEPSQVGSFYTRCKSCKTWHDFEVTRECLAKHIEVEIRKL